MNEAVITVLFYVASCVAIIFVFVPHEFAHALAAHLNGDLTPKLNGRLTLNPIKHFDTAVFNLMPLFPLDGFRVLEALIKPYNRVRQFLAKYGQIILLVLVAESFICNIAARYIQVFDYLNILGYVMTFATDYLGWPIKAFWGIFI